MRLFKRPSHPTPPLGELEIAVLRYIWANGDVDARTVLTGLTARGITLSTVQATLERLHRKGLLERSKVGRAFRYRAAITQSRLIGSLIRDLSRQLAAGELEPVISGFVELVDEAGPELLAELQAQAERRRRERS